MGRRCQQVSLRATAGLSLSDGKALNGTRPTCGKCPPRCRRGRRGGSGHRRLLLVQAAGPAARASPRPGTRQPGLRPLPDHFALELGQCPEQVENQLAARSGRVDLLAQAAKAPACLCQVADGFNQVPSERPSRSSRQTTKVSPLRRWSRASAKPGRAVFAPLATSVKMRSHPAACRF